MKAYQSENDELTIISILNGHIFATFQIEIMLQSLSRDSRELDSKSWTTTSRYLWSILLSPSLIYPSIPKE